MDHRRFSSCIGASVAAALFSYGVPASAKPVVIDDQKIAQALYQALKKAADQKELPTADQLAVAANKSNYFKPKVPLPMALQTSRGNGYNELSRSVYLVMSIFKCGKCSQWHQGTVATAWCLGEDGLMVTNAHVFRNAKGGAMGVGDREGNCHTVTDLLGIDVAADIAIFRVKASGLPRLALGQAAEVGIPVTAITNPSGNFYFHSSGTVARYFQRREKLKDSSKMTTWMSVTADYAKGSSGGPVFNAAGEVVGMVSTTSSIYTGTGTGTADKAPSGNLQMVVKSCVPVDSIHGLFAAEKAEASEQLPAQN
jgi:serine protease Do